MSEDRSGDRPDERLVLSYFGDEHYHRSLPEDELRPACRPTRIRGVLSMRVRAERQGQTPCPDCWPGLHEGT